MPKVTFVKSARKANPRYGIEVGDSYYHWSFMVGGRGGPKICSKTYPKRSQLTNSDFLKQQYDLEDRIAEAKTPEDFREIAADITTLGEEQGEKYDNMPDGLREGPTGELLDERRQGCEDWAQAVEEAADALETKFDELSTEEDEHNTAVAAWEEYEAARTEWEAACEAWAKGADGEEPHEPEEPADGEPEERDFEDERNDAADEVRGDCDPSF